MAFLSKLKGAFLRVSSYSVCFSLTLSRRPRRKLARAYSRVSHLQESATQRAHPRSRHCVVDDGIKFGAIDVIRRTGPRDSSAKGYERVRSSTPNSLHFLSSIVSKPLRSRSQHAFFATGVTSMRRVPNCTFERF